MAERDWDWNAIVGILDTLSEDTYSFVELADYIGRAYGRDVISKSLELLEKRELICVLDGSPTGSDLREADENERSRRIRAFFEIADAERCGSVENWIALSEGGRSFLRLVGIGHPN